MTQVYVPTDIEDPNVDDEILEYVFQKPRIGYWVPESDYTVFEFVHEEDAIIFKLKFGL